MGHYFINEDLEHNKKIIKVIIKNEDFSFITDNGVFSKKGLDFGTRTLLENLDYKNINGKILDFGCGYGSIGIIVSKFTGLEVDMLDINKRSIELAKENSRLNKVKTNIFESNIYENVQDKYDYIISNPPIRVGNEILYKILFEAKDHLNDNGKLIIVVNKDQGAKSLMEKLKKFYNVNLIAKNKGFFVILCSK
jgi:16S rRNA (guanine1207-N2)-methyltransferase